MQKLPNLKAGGGKGALGNEDNWNESQTQVMLGLMARTIGSPIEFQRLLDATFNSSVAGLTDSVGWNDFYSFRLLAKVLACVPGLERDARIALSCQFSITDVSVDHGNSDASDEMRDDTVILNDVLRVTGALPDGNIITPAQQDQSSMTEIASANEGHAVTRTTKITIDSKPGASEAAITKEAQITDSKPAALEEEEGEEDLTPEDSRWMTAMAIATESTRAGKAPVWCISACCVPIVIFVKIATK